MIHHIILKYTISNRTESEGYNSRFKNINIENVAVKNIYFLSKLNTLGNICILIAIIAIIINKMKIRFFSN